jgi:integrase
VSKTVLEAGQRVLKEGTFSREWYDRAVKAAAKKAKVTDFAPGSMRHSVATWGVDAGAALNEMSAFLGHKSPRTTTKFYARHSTPKKVPTLK